MQERKKKGYRIAQLRTKWHQQLVMKCTKLGAERMPSTELKDYTNILLSLVETPGL